jgi:hypothetical protein
MRAGGGGGEIWEPKLELLVAKFGALVNVTPRFAPSTREAVFDFTSSLAHVRLTLTAYTDVQIHKLTLAYDLEIRPILMKFTPHAELEFPLDGVNKEPSRNGSTTASWTSSRPICRWAKTSTT